MNIHFPDSLKESIKLISKQFNFKVALNTHYDALNIELSIIKGYIQMRIDFEIDQVNQNIDVTLYKDKFPLSPRLLLWCHHHIPFFPPFSKITWKELDKLPLNEDSKFYTKKIYSFIREECNATT